QLQRIATDLGVTETEVVNMDRRMMMGGDASLNVPLHDQAEGQWQDLLTDDHPLQDDVIADAQESSLRRHMLSEATKTLTDRERQILIERRLIDEPKTLGELSERHHVSRERIRQIEVRAFEKVQKAMQRISAERHLAADGLTAPLANRFPAATAL